MTTAQSSTTPQARHAASQWAFEVRAEDSELEIDVYDVVGSSWFEDSVTAKYVLDKLREQPTATTIRVRINSAGGDVFDGLAIYNLLAQQNARVIVEIDGLAASIASIIAMAGDDIRMAENALMMIHDPWTFTLGSAKDMRDAADLLDIVRAQLLDTYAARVGGGAATKRELDAMMADETWFTATEAKAVGLITQITPAKRASAHLLPPSALAQFHSPPRQAFEHVSPQHEESTMPKKVFIPGSDRTPEEWDRLVRDTIASNAARLRRTRAAVAIAAAGTRPAQAAPPGRATPAAKIDHNRSEILEHVAGERSAEIEARAQAAERGKVEAPASFRFSTPQPPAPVPTPEDIAAHNPPPSPLSSAVDASQFGTQEPGESLSAFASRRANKS